MDSKHLLTPEYVSWLAEKKYSLVISGPLTLVPQELPFLTITHQGGGVMSPPAASKPPKAAPGAPKKRKASDMESQEFLKTLEELEKEGRLEEMKTFMGDALEDNFTKGSMGWKKVAKEVKALKPKTLVKKTNPMILAKAFEDVMDGSTSDGEGAIGAGSGAGLGGVRSCSICHSPGHNKRTCPTGSSEASLDDSSEDTSIQEFSETEDESEKPKAKKAKTSKKPKAGKAPEAKEEKFQFKKFGESMQIPAGTYYIGDPSLLVENDSPAMEAYRKRDYDDGQYTSPTGTFVVALTEAGEGIFEGTNGCRYKVTDLGALCIMDSGFVNKAMAEKNRAHISVHTFDRPVKVSWDLGIYWFKSPGSFTLAIDTKSE